MLYHHGPGSYKAAASEAAAKAREKFHAKFEAGQQKLAGLIERLSDEQPVDRLGSTRDLRFSADKNGIQVEFGTDAPAMRVHRNALHQIAAASEKTLTTSTMDAMLNAGEWGRDLLTDALGRVYANVKREKVLVRHVEPAESAPEIRAILSNRYRRFDSGDIFSAVLASTVQSGALPVETSKSDLMWSAKFLQPTIYEPLPDEVMIFGVCLRHSDFGAGALDIRFVSERLWCTNHALTERLLKEVHLGKEISEDGIYSDQTRELDAKLLASKANDIVRYAISEDRIGMELKRIQDAAAAGFTGKQADVYLDRLVQGQKINKGEKAAVVEAFTSTEVEMLPRGANKWRLAQTFGWLAQQPERTAESRERFEHLAGAILDPTFAAAA